MNLKEKLWVCLRKHSRTTSDNREDLNVSWLRLATLMPDVSRPFYISVFVAKYTIKYFFTYLNEEKRKRVILWESFKKFTS